MKKLTNVKAAKLRRNDIVKIAGVKYKIVTLRLSFGSKTERVHINLWPAGTTFADIRGRYVHLDVKSNTRFTVRRK